QVGEQVVGALRLQQRLLVAVLAPGVLARVGGLEEASARHPPVAARERRAEAVVGAIRTVRELHAEDLALEGLRAPHAAEQVDDAETPAEAGRLIAGGH